MDPATRELIQQLHRKFVEHNVKVDEVFLAFDDDGDGEISPDEFRKGLTAMALNITTEEIEKLLKHFDSDGD
eukprot:SAG11_NODE_8547_length_1002_cov_1.467331_2_plen_71_part_01